jgi:hypothetical protein
LREYVQDSFLIDTSLCSSAFFYPIVQNSPPSQSHYVQSAIKEYFLFQNNWIKRTEWLIEHNGDYLMDPLQPMQSSEFQRNISLSICFS